MADVIQAGLSHSVAFVASRLAAEPLSAQDLATAMLAEHADEYGRGTAASLPVDWPSRPRRAPVQAWLTEIRSLFVASAHREVHGRAVILGLALADPVAGREIVRAGVFHAVAAELSPPLPDGLTPLGRERLAALPLAATLDATAGPLWEVGLDGAVTAVAFSPNGQLVAVGWDRPQDDAGWVVIARSGRQVISGTAEQPLIRVAFSADNAQVLVGAASLQTFDMAGELRGRWETGQVLAIAPDVAIGTRGMVRPVGGGLAQGPANFAVIADAGPVVAVERDGDIVALDRRSFEPVARAESLPGRQRSMALSADGSRLAFGTSDGFVRVWDVRGGRAVWSGEVSGEGITALAFSPDATRLAAALSGEIALLDAASGRRVATLDQRGLWQPVFSPDGTLLAAGGADGSLRVWNAATGALLGGIQHPSAVEPVAWSPDGDELVAGTRGGTVHAWPTGLAPARRTRLTAYAADDVSEASKLDVRLDIDADVDALAALVAARKVTPPLSIGLFGDWGSGKTFFMRRLQARVRQLAADARGSGELQRDVAWHKRIVQVEFNAWHYAEGNLWASLVEHLLDNLRLSPDEPQDRVMQRKRQVIEQITSQEAVAADVADKLEQSRADLDDANERRDQLARELADIRSRDPLASTRPGDEVIRMARAAAAAVVTPGDAETLTQLEGELTRAHEVLQRGGRVVATLQQAPDRRGRYAWLLALVVGLPLIGGIVAALVPDAAALAATAAAMLGSVTEWVRRQVAWTSERLDEVERAQRALEEPARNALEQQELAVKQKQAEHDEAVRAAEQEQERLQTLKAALAAATPARMLAALVADRVESDDYRRHLGVLALVRRDFEAISDYLQLAEKDIERYTSLEEEDADADVRVGRIVLYIDDLDRCPPRQVVNVLQAVHLLLAYPLFVVVVGVDVRWVEHALALRHQHLLDPDGGARPRDYLEKIFQIPFWIEPLDADASRRMLRGVLGDEIRETAVVVTQATPHGAPPGDGASGTDAPARDGEAPARQSEAGPKPPPPRRLPPPPDLQPERLDIGTAELECMDALAPLLGRSPRGLKRFLNTYRLVKVRAPDAIGFLAEARPLADFRIVLFLLALCTGTPHAAASFLDATLAGEPADAATMLKNLATLPDERGRLEDWLADPVSEPWRTLAAADLRDWAAEVARFTFHASPGTHTPAA